MELYSILTPPYTATSFYSPLPLPRTANTTSSPNSYELVAVVCVYIHCSEKRTQISSFLDFSGLCCHKTIQVTKNCLYNLILYFSSHATLSWPFPFTDAVFRSRMESSSSMTVISHPLLAATLYQKLKLVFHTMFNFPSPKVAFTSKEPITVILS
jgi:hypothetical protein